MRKLFFILLAASMLLCSCGGDEILSAFAARDAVRLQVAGVEQLSFDPVSCQMAFSRQKRQFRVFTDNMSDYFVITLSRIPTSSGEEVSGNLSYTTRTSTVNRKNITLKVIRLEGDRIWLWNRQYRTGIEVQVLD